MDKPLLKSILLFNALFIFSNSYAQTWNIPIANTAEPENTFIGTISNNPLNLRTNNVNTLSLTNYELDIKVSDLKLGTGDSRSIGLKPAQRALSHFENDILVLNVEGDFEGGIAVQGIGIGIGTVPLPNIKLAVNGTALIGTFTENNDTYTKTFDSCPNLKLLVVGTIGAKEVHISTKSWCDFVFDKNYPLKPLQEVEKYININKHLPDVPSEKEVVENGIAMSEMLKIQMKKIEELTLYMIELKKENQELKRLIKVATH